MSDEQAIRNLMAVTASRLDREDLTGWLELFDAESSYEIEAYSTEIRCTMSWWKSDRAALEHILEEAPRHESDRARRLHLLGAIEVELDAGHARAQAPFAVYRTLPDGSTSLYVVGRYENSMIKREGRWRYTYHKAVLETRVLDAFTHLPL